MSRSILGAVVAALVILAWLASGHLGADGSRAAPVAADPARSTAPPMRVQVAEIEPGEVLREVVLQGFAEPWRRVELRVQTAGLVESVEVDKGARLRQGEPVLRLAVDDRKARVDEAKARVKQLEIELEAARRLQQSGLQARVRAEQAEADLAAAMATLERAGIELSYTRIDAPFAGVLNRRHVEVGDFLDRGAAAASLVDDRWLRVRGEVAQQSVAGLRVGQAGEVRFITGEVRQGRIVYLSATADPVTRSFAVELQVDNKAGELRAGMSTEIRIPVEKLVAHFVSPAVLSLGEKGELGIKTVSADNRVELNPIRIVRTTTDGIWVSGLPGRARVIVQGQGFVREGERVTAVTGSAG